jgi:nitrogenase molybdenum-iron protein beta chain
MLDGTTSEIKPRQALRINPAKTCQPIGAMYAALGINGCMPHSHGSQGCCSYHRSHLTRHFKEPVVATTSSFTEGASVFGGLANMTQALSNIFTIYNPQIVAVHTTCLSEVIIPTGKRVIHANTPSFVGSHVTGFASMVTGMVRYLAESSGVPAKQLNLIPGYIDPSEMRELKRIVAEMGVSTVMFPDTSGVLDLPQDGQYRMFPSGGATVEQIKTTADSSGTIALGHFASHPAAKELDEKFNVPCALLELPYGLTNTDRFIHALRNHGGVEVPKTLVEERGRLLDAMGDMHQYFHGKRVAVVGDPDHVIALTQFLLELDMKPAYIITGSPGNHFESRVKEILGDQGTDVIVKQNADLFDMHQWTKNNPVDLIIGNTYCKYICRAENIPFVRFGFPVLDRMGHRYFPSVGYTGALRLMEKINDALLDHNDRECAEENFELVQ